MQRYGKRPRDRSGFTLIEMVVVIIIVAVMSSVAVPYYSQFYAKTRFRASVQQTVDLLGWARSAAIQAGMDSTVHFDAQTETFGATVDAPAALADLPAYETDAGAPPQQPETRTVSMGDQVAVTGFAVFSATSGQTGGTDLQFHEDGSSDGGEITVVSRDGYFAQIEIAPATGKVSVNDDPTTAQQAR